MLAKLASSTKLSCNVGESCAGVLADACNSSQANNDNKRQHDRVFNSGRSVFALQKALQLHGEIFHLDNPPTGGSIDTERKL